MKKKISKKSYSKENIIGLYENIEIKGNGVTKKVLARIDTGATKSSIDMKLAAKLQLGPIIGIKPVKSSLGETLRPMIMVTVVLNGKKIKAKFTISDRDKLKYSVLIGQNILKKGFIIDPKKSTRLS